MDLASALANARVIDLEQPRTVNMPIWPGHRPGYQYVLHKRHADTPDGKRSGASGLLVMKEHTGTHIDALCHQACGGELFGGVNAAAAETPAGFTEHGIETLAPLLGPAVLLDVAAAKGVARLPEGYSITATDFAACGVAVEPGDVVLVRTGFAQCWGDEESYLRAAGVSKAGTLWCAERGARAVGIDNMVWDLPTERDPETGATLFAHVYLLPQKGVPIIENLNLEELSRTGVTRFGFVGIPLKFVGATGSPLRPLALLPPANT
jgi:kynurenine formamidase